MRYKTALLVTMLLAGCNSGRNLKNISIFSEASFTGTTAKNHVVVYLNNNIVTDKLVNHSDISKSEFIDCLTIDSTKNNVIVIQINNKVIKIDPGKYPGKCLEIFTECDTRVKIYSAYRIYEKYSIEKRGVIPEPKAFFDSIKATHPGDKYDSITYGIQLNKCWCDSVRK